MTLNFPFRMCSRMSKLNNVAKMALGLWIKDQLQQVEEATEMAREQEDLDYLDNLEVMRQDLLQQLDDNKVPHNATMMAQIIKFALTRISNSKRKMSGVITVVTAYDKFRRYLRSLSNAQ